MKKRLKNNILVAPLAGIFLFVLAIFLWDMAGGGVSKPDGIEFESLSAFRKILGTDAEREFLNGLLAMKRLKGEVGEYLYQAVAPPGAGGRTGGVELLALDGAGDSPWVLVHYPALPKSRVGVLLRIYDGRAWAVGARFFSGTGREPLLEAVDLVSRDTKTLRVLHEGLNETNVKSVYEAYFHPEQDGLREVAGFVRDATTRDDGRPFAAGVKVRAKIEGDSFPRLLAIGGRILFKAEVADTARAQFPVALPEGVWFEARKNGIFFYDRDAGGYAPDPEKSDRGLTLNLFSRAAFTSGDLSTLFPLEIAEMIQKGSTGQKAFLMYLVWEGCFAGSGSENWKILNYLAADAEPRLAEAAGVALRHFGTPPIRNFLKTDPERVSIPDLKKVDIVAARGGYKGDLLDPYGAFDYACHTCPELAAFRMRYQTLFGPDAQRRFDAVRRINAAFVIATIKLTDDKTAVAYLRRRQFGSEEVYAARCLEIFPNATEE